MNDPSPSVLATVHANDAVSAVSRLADMGLQHATIAQTLRGAIAQRLLRRVCTACAEPVRGQLTPDEQRLTDKHGIEPVVRAVGCPECGFTGYRGRLPSNEVLVVGPRFQQTIEQRKGWSSMSRVAGQGGILGLALGRRFGRRFGWRLGWGLSGRRCGLRLRRGCALGRRQQRADL